MGRGGITGGARAEEMWRRVQTIHGSAPKRRAPQFSGAQPPGCSHRTSVFPRRQTWRRNRRCRVRGAADDNSTIEWGWEEAPGCSWRYLARRFRFRCEPAMMFWKDVQCKTVSLQPLKELRRLKFSHSDLPIFLPSVCMCYFWLNFMIFEAK